MKFGLMCQIQMPRPWKPDAEQTAYRNALDHVAAAEAAGFSHLWVTEQHFFMEIGHCSSQDMFLAAASQRTRTMRLGFGVILVPCHNPFMVAERVATLDVLSGGRAEFGFGRGTSPYIVEGLGFDPTIGREVGEEALKAVLMMHESEWFPGHKGKHFNLAARHVVPRPVQRPHPPLWIAASNFETYAHAGRMGVGLMGVTRNTPEETKPAIATYREALRTANPADFVGRFANPQVGAFAIACVLDDDRAGQAAACAAARWYYGDNDAELNRARFTTGGGVQKVFEKISSRTDEELIEDAMTIGGNPDTVCRQVEKWAKAGLDQIAFLFQAGHTTHEQVMRSIELVGEKVIPRFAA